MKLSRKKRISGNELPDSCMTPSDDQSAVGPGASELHEYIDNMSTFNAKIGIDGRFLLVGRAAAQAVGFNKQDLLKMNFLDGPWWAFDPQVHARIKDAFKQAANGSKVNFNEHVRVRDGLVLRINFSLCPVKNAKGVVDYIVAEGRDITQQEAAEAQLRERDIALCRSRDELEHRVRQRTAELSSAIKAMQHSEQRLQSILDNTMAIIYVKDHEGKYVLVNRGWEEVAKCSRETAIGKGVVEFFPAEFTSQIEANDREVLKRGEAIKFEEVIVSGGKPRTFISVKFPLTLEPGQPDGLCGISTDITEQKLIEKSFRENEARAKAILDSALDCVISMNQDGRIIEWNPGATTTFGYTRDEALGKKVAELIIPKYMREQHARGTARFLATGIGPVIGKRLEVSALKKDGTEFPVELSVNLIPIPGPPMFTAYLRDISDRRRMENALRFSAEASAVLASSLDYESTLKSVARLAVPAIADWFSIDLLKKNGVIERVASYHPNAELLARGRDMHARHPLSADEPHGVAQVIRDGIASVVPEITDQMIAAVSKSAEQLDFQRRLHLCSCMVVPLIARGKVLGAVSFVTAESGRKYTQADLPIAEDLARRAAIAVDNATLFQQAQHARHEAEATNRSKDEFLAVVSHELRTPLTPIMGWTRLLQTSKFDAATLKRGLESIDRNVRAQTQLIEDLLDISRIVTGKLRLNLHHTRLADVITAAIETTRPATLAKGIKLDISLDSDSLAVVGDHDRLQQVVWNLLSNAVKFSAQNGRIVLTLKKVASSAHISVTDFGEGIAPEFLPQMFNRFTQADSSSTRAYGGLGLGLAIVRHIVELHGGTVNAESAGKGRGATITAILPLTTPIAEAVQKDTNHNRSAAASFSPAANLKDLIVLVVDDDADSREFVAEVLKQWGARVTAVKSVNDAMAEISQQKPDVLISDIGMPEKDGYDLIRQIRDSNESEVREIPAIALTAYARAEDRIRILAEGFQVHVPKPLDPMELVAAVANVSHRSRKRSARC